MNWYKLASHPLSEKLTTKWSSKLFKKLLEDFYYVRKRSKEPDADLDPDYFYTGFVPEGNFFNVTHISAKMEVVDRDEIAIMGRTSINKGRFNHPTLLDEYPENKIYLTIDLPRDFGEKDFEKLSYHIKEVLRHEIEHTTPAQKSRTEDTMSLVMDTETEMGMRRRLGYYLNPIEIEAFVTGVYYSAKKKREPFISYMDNYLNTIKNDIYNVYKRKRPDKLIENVFIEIRKKWLDYAMKRYPNLMKLF